MSVDFILFVDDNDYELRLPLYYPHIISNTPISQAVGVHYENTLRNTFLILYAMTLVSDWS